MTKTKIDVVGPVIGVLVRAGFVPNGFTAEEHVRVPTQRSPLYGGIGGEARTFGGRSRYQKPGTNLRVTGGPRTVNVYRVTAGGASFIANYQTRDGDLDELLTLLTDTKD